MENSTRNHRSKLHQQKTKDESFFFIILGIKDKDRYVSQRKVKENIKSENLLTKKLLRILEHMKRPTLRILEIEEVEETQLKSYANIYNKNHKKKTRF